MKIRAWAGPVLVFIALIAVFWVLRGLTMTPSEAGFALVSPKDESLLISDSEVLSYNWASQEMTLTDSASQRLMQKGDDLYKYDEGFVIKIEGEEVYQGIFRSPDMSAIPEPPKISVMFPSVFSPYELPNNHAMKMFYPWFEPPSDQPEKNSKLSQYFEGVNKLTC